MLIFGSQLACILNLFVGKKSNKPGTPGYIPTIFPEVKVVPGKPSNKRAKIPGKRRTTKTSRAAGRYEPQTFTKKPEHAVHVPSIFSDKPALKEERQSCQASKTVTGNLLPYNYTIKREIIGPELSEYSDKMPTNVASQSWTISKVEGSGSALPSQVLWALGHNPETASLGTTPEAILNGTDSLQPPEDHDESDSEPQLSDHLPPNSETFISPTAALSCAPHTDTPKPHKGKRHILCPCCDTKILSSGSTIQSEAVLGAHLITFHKMRQDFAVRFVMRRRLIDRVIATRGPLLCTMCREPMGDEEMMNCFTRDAPGTSFIRILQAG